MSTALIVQARMTSTRLPGKVLMPLGGRPMLECLLARLRRVSLADRIIIATTTNATDDAIARFCENNSVDCYRGSEHDVLSRYAEAAQRYGADTVVRITSDCPLLDPALVDHVISAYREAGVDYASNMLEPSCPYGMAVEVFSKEVLLQAHSESIDAAEREHVTPFIYWHPERYALKSVKLDRNLSGHRWTVDTHEDYELIKLIYSEVYPKNPEFDMEDVLAVMDRHPDWKKINQHIEQKQLKHTPKDA